MSRRKTGTSLIFTAAFLYAVHFLTAAIYGSGMVSWNDMLFQSLLDYTDQGLIPASRIALAAGLIYLVWAEIEAFSSRTKAS